MFDIIKRQKDFSFYLAIFPIVTTGHFLKNKLQSQFDQFCEHVFSTETAEVTLTSSGW